MEQLSLAEAAAYLGVSVQTLTKWRHQNKGPTSWLTPANRVAFCREDLDRFITEHAQATTRGGR